MSKRQRESTTEVTIHFGPKEITNKFSVENAAKPQFRACRFVAKDTDPIPLNWVGVPERYDMYAVIDSDGLQTKVYFPPDQSKPQNPRLPEVRLL